MQMGLDLNHPFYILEFDTVATVLVVLIEPLDVAVVPEVVRVLRARMPVHVMSIVVSAHAWVTVEEIEAAFILGGRDGVRALLARPR